jgi:hypothetical protein
MDGACITYGEKRGVSRIFVGKPEGKNHLEDLGVDGILILKCIFKTWDGSMKRIYLAQDGTVGRLF